MESVRDVSELMNENVANLANGVFAYNRPRLRFDETKLEIEAKSGTEVSGVFRFWVDRDVEANGLVFATSVRMRLSISEFSAQEVELKYYFDGTGMEEGDVIRGDICIISDCGEYTIPFAALKKREPILTVVGPIKNLFHFANLARENWAEAVRVFYSKEFISVFSGHDRQYIDIYRGLLATKTEQNVEEFLITIKKKTPLTYSIEGENLPVVVEDAQVFTKELYIDKNGWGYVDLEVISDNEAVSTDKFLYESDDFNPSAPLNLTIDPALLHDGKNYALITLKYPGGIYKYELCLVKNPIKIESMRGYLKYQAYKGEIIKTYIDFRIHNINKAEWERKTMQLTEHILIHNPEEISAVLMRAHVLIIQGKIKEGQALIEKLKSLGTDEERGYKVYLECLIKGDRLSAKEAADFIGSLYRRRRSQTLLWLLLYVDENLRNDPVSVLKMLKHQAENAKMGPLLYLEGYHIYANHPEMLDSLGNFELQVMNFAAKTGLFQDELQNRLIYISQNAKEYNPILHNILEAFYIENEDERVLLNLCTNLIRGEKKDTCYNKYYEKAVMLNMRITLLYEYYLYSLPRDSKKLIPRSVIKYFSFGNGLGSQDRAFLYANLITNKEHASADYNSYVGEMESFAIEEILKGNIEANLAIIVNEFSKHYAVTKAVNEKAAEVMFTHQINFDDSDIQYVVVVETPFVLERKYPVFEGRAFAKIYSKEYCLYAEYIDGSRKLISDYLGTPLIDTFSFADGLLTIDKPSVGIAVAVSEMDGKGVHIHERNERFVRILLDSEEISEDYKREYRKELLDYYYDKDKFEQLDEYLLSVNPKVITPYDRDALVEFLVMRDMQDAAYGIVAVYGGENIEPRLLVKLCSKLIFDLEDECDEGILYLAHQAFLAGKYDMATLSYMTQHFRGTAKQLRDLHRAAINFEMETIFLEERILKQMLFTGSFVAGKENIVEHYFKSFPFSILSQACISYDSWEFFVHEAVVEDALFDRIIKTAEDGIKLNEICALALIYYYSERKERLEVPDLIYSCIRGLLKTGIFFQFFLAFKDEVPELVVYEKRTFVEYRANPASKVLLHYILETGDNDDSYKKEEMKEIRGGIFLKSFLMFYGENLQYYITEENRGRENLTESREISKSDQMMSPHESRYDVLNDMIFAQSLKDEKSLLAMMDLFHKKDYIANSIFTIKEADIIKENTEGEE